MDWAELAARPLPWAIEGGAETGTVLFTRVLAFRNFAGEPFPISAPPERCERIAARTADYAARRGLGTAVRLRDCGDGLLRMLRERHLIAEPPVPLPGRKGIKFLALGGDEGVFAWINEVEHLTWIRVFPGLPFLSENPTLLAAPPEEPETPWARSPRYGILTSDPAKAGPGIAFQCVVHLPALALFRKLDQVHAALSALGAGFTPVTRMSAARDSDTALFRIASLGGPGETPEAAWGQFLSLLRPVLDWESEARALCLRNHRKRLEAGVRGAFDILDGSRALDFPRLQACLSWLRLGASLGLVEARILPILEQVRAFAQSGHLEVSSDHVLSKEEEDIIRASVVKLSMERYRARA